MNEVAIKIGKFIKDKRTSGKISTTALANKINMSQSYLSAIENATKNTTPNIYILYKICVGLSHFGLNKRELLLEVFHLYNTDDSIDNIDREIFETLIKEDSSINSMESIPPDLDIDLYELFVNEHSYSLSYSYSTYNDNKINVPLPMYLKKSLNEMTKAAVYQYLLSNYDEIALENIDEDLKEVKEKADTNFEIDNIIGFL